MSVFSFLNGSYQFTYLYIIGGGFMKKEVARFKIFEYLFVTFFITWICWGTIVISNQFGFLKYGTTLSMILFLIGGNGPPIASYILLKKWGKIDGIIDFLKLNFNAKASLKDYSLVVLLLLLHFIIPILLFSTNREVPLYYGLAMIPINIFGGGLEEIGWRGILQPYLEELISFTNATITVAIIWSVWHLPLWYIVGTFQSDISFLYFGVAVVGMSFAIAAIRKVTENIFLCILFHSILNSFWGVFMLEQNYTTFVITFVELVLAIAIVKSLSKPSNNLVEHSVG